MNDWIWVNPTTKLRKLPDGTWHGVRTEPVAATLDAARRMRGDALKQPSLARTTGDGNTLVAVMPKTLAMEMDITCGADPEKQAMFLRDHPEVRTCARGDAKLPPKRQYFYPGKREPRK